MHKTMDYLDSLNAFIIGNEDLNFVFYHCPFHQERDLSLKLIEKEYFYCYKCAKCGSYESLLIHCKSYMKRPLDDFRRENFQKDWYSLKDNRTLHRAQERRYKKKGDTEE